MESQLIDAIKESKTDVVLSLLEKGVNVNYVPLFGKSPLSTAAELGNVSIMKLLLNAYKRNHLISDVKDQESDSSSIGDFSKGKQSSNCLKTQTSEHKNNLGYYVFVHDEDESLTLVNKGDSLDIDTPEDMDSLEWFLEVEGVEDNVPDDVWSMQYRWYADILDKTSNLLEEEGRSCDVNLPDNRGYCAIHYAVESSQLEALQCLISAGCELNVSDMDKLSPLHVAAMHNRLEEARLLIQRRARVNTKTSDKQAPLHISAVRGFLDMVKLLVEAGAKVDPVDTSDRTPMYLAVTRGHFDVVKFLIESGAKVNIEEVHGYTPLCEAVWSKSVETASLLMSKGAKLTQSHYLLHYAVLHRQLKMAELLLKNGAYPNLRDDSGDTPLLLAINAQDLDMMRLLLQNGANPNYPSSISNLTPLQKAITHEGGKNKPEFFEEELKLLCEYNVDLNQAAGTRMRSPLMTAFLCDFSCVAALIRAGADVNLVIESELTVGAHFRYQDPSFLTQALANQAIDIVHLMVTAGYKIKGYSVDVPQDWSTVDTDTLQGWLTHMKYNPRKLADLCRQEIRRQMGSKVFVLVPELEIPQSLKQYLLYKDIYVKRYLFKERLYEEQEDSSEDE